MAKQKKNDPPAEPKQVDSPKLPKQGSPLLTILVILLVLVGVGEAALWGYWGFGTYRANQALKLQEKQREAEEEQTGGGVAAGSALGPGLKVENGVVTWQWEDELDGGAGLPALSAGFTQSGGEKRLSGLWVPEINYVLAEQETDVQRPDPAEDPVST